MPVIKVGIIGAMECEVTYLRDQIEFARTKEVLGTAYTEGELAGMRVVLARCGVGKVNAAICAQVMLGTFGVTHVINTGVAGALDSRVEIGDLVVSTDAVEHDMDVTPLGFKPGEHPDMHVVAFPADPALRAAVVEAAGKVATDVHTFEGRVCSGDQFIGSAAAKQRIVDTFGGACCEMEGAAIAHVCYLADAPYVVVRAMSDKADDDSGVSDYPTFEKQAAKHCAEIVLAALPKIR